ncbi:MAG: hypothetical protein RR846_05455, partial [Oscillospiraceae bacterium]
LCRYHCTLYNEFVLYFQRNVLYHKFIVQSTMIAAEPPPHRSGAICRSNVLMGKSASFSRHCEQCRSGFHATHEVIIPYIPKLFKS